MTNSIVRVRLENFQSHKESVIEPAPPGELTVLVGGSDGGKTAVLRALRWAFYNVPQGIDFIRVGANYAKVRIEYADGSRVSRARSHKGFNRYITGQEPATDGHMFEGFGNSVPLEIQQITGVRPIEIGDMTLYINLADQLSGPFLGSLISAPARAKVLGKLAGTEEVDYAAKACGTDLYRRKQDKERHQDDVARLQEAISKYAYLEDLGAKIEQAEILLNGIKAKMDMEEKLKRLRAQRVQIHQSLQDVLTSLIYLENIICYAEPLLAETAQNIDRLTRFAALSTRWGMVVCQGTIEEVTLRRTERVGEAEILLSCVTKRRDRLNILDRGALRLAGIGQWLQSATKTLDATQTIDEAYLLARTVQGNTGRLGALRSASDRLVYHAEDLAMLDQQLSGLAGTDKAVIVLEHIKEQVLTYRQLSHLSLQKGKDGLRGKIEECGQQIIYWTVAEQDLGAEYRDTLLAARVCPMCGSTITKENLREAI